MSLIVVVTINGRRAMIRIGGLLSFMQGGSSTPEVWVRRRVLPELRQSIIGRAGIGWHRLKIRYQEKVNLVKMSKSDPSM